VEDIRFIKTNSLPYTTTGDLYISCNTSDTYDNDGGYIIGKLNYNFLNGVPTQLEWQKIVWAESYAKQVHPWDVTSDGRVYYVSGAAHGYDWSALYCLDADGERQVVEHWRTHWLEEGGEWHGAPASTCPIGTPAYSGIALKIWNRCELRSWTTEEYQEITPDGNGGTRKGHWPADILFSGPCDPNDPSADGPGYTGYSAEACCPVWGASSVVVDRSTNNLYLGMNFKSYHQASNTPDFEPAVIAFDPEGDLLWWSRLYHEITPQGDTMFSLPDQYVDALAIDYAHQSLVVVARAHGNNTENLWEGNTIAMNPSASAFQNQFTGTNGNIHQSWIGKLSLATGDLQLCTYLAEYAEATGGFGDPLTDPNLAGWPNPNSGWPDVNTTYAVKNNVKVSSNGDVVIGGQGRRTITTHNAWQEMPLPQNGGLSCWNSFVRMYQHDLKFPKYSSLIIGQWDTLTQQGGDNIRLFGLYKTKSGILAVGKHLADDLNQAQGADMPLNQVPAWGATQAQGESAVLVYLKADSLNLAADGALHVAMIERPVEWEIFPVPAKDQISVHIALNGGQVLTYTVHDITGKRMLSGRGLPSILDVSSLPNGVYTMKISTEQGPSHRAFMVMR
jgi:Secretion system C-terminal sorting domain